ncbi:MAG TPA: response regulator [Longimicrobiales bacterium]|nr:response regulator [Longimicrobiales bacterium]
MNAHKKVMFVDDEESVRTSWDRYLSAQGFEVTTAEDGGKAISKLRNEEVDVVVSDLKMPGVDGVQLLEWIHSKRPETQFILLTGYGSEDVERTVRQLGAFDYLNKPISPDTLAAVVTAATHLKLLPKEQAPVAVEAGPAVMESQPTAVEETAVEAQVLEEVVVPKSGLRRTAEIVGGLIAAPILGLAFVVFLPVIGFGALFWMLGESLWDRFKPAEV